MFKKHFKGKKVKKKFLNGIYIRISDVPDPQFQVRPDPDSFFKLESGGNGSGYLTKMATSGRIRILNTLSYL